MMFAYLFMFYDCSGDLMSWYKWIPEASVSDSDAVKLAFTMMVEKDAERVQILDDPRRFDSNGGRLFVCEITA